MARLALSVGRRGAGLFRGTSCLDGNARRFRGIRMNRHSSYWVFLVHRLSGIALALFLPVHFWALGHPLQLDAFLAWTEQPLLKFSQWPLVVLLAAHRVAELRVLTPHCLP